MGCKFYGLNEKVENGIYRHKGISSLYDWQKECLKIQEENFKKNFIYSVPTSGGKTLVAEILMLQEIFVRKKNAVFIVPFVSIVQEKVSALSPLALELGFWVEEYAGSKGVYPPSKHRKKNSLYVCTIEKGSGLINSLIEHKRLSEIGIVVFDELHLIGEPRRGALLESICIKLKKLNIKIVGMSATIGNLADIATFLEAEMYTHNFRPGSLNEFVKVENELFSISHKTGKLDIEFHSRVPDQSNKLLASMDPDGLGVLVQEVIPLQSCLVFCQSKKNCENVATLLVETIKLGDNTTKILRHKQHERDSLIKAIQDENNGAICPILQKTIPYGIVYHHSGITFSERKLMEEAYSAGTINCICCTSTLAAGVNLPAQRVILRAPFVGCQFISKTTYRQMIGRAGRAGLVEKGESILICKPNLAADVLTMMSNPIDCCTSQLVGEELKTFILSCYFYKLVVDKKSLRDLLETSFLRLSSSEEEVSKMVSNIMNDLIEMRILSKNGSLTPFGSAVAKANLNCETGSYLMQELLEAQKKLVLINDLHLLYLVTPHGLAESIKPVHEVVSCVYSSLRKKELYVANCLGITESVIARIIMGSGPPKSISVRVLEKFFLCLMLYQLWLGKDIRTVANLFKVDRGFVQNLLTQTTSYASAVIRFCEAIDSFWPFVKLLSHYPDKLNYCCSSDLLPLMELPAVKIGRAKQLYKAGFKTVLSIAKSDPQHLVNSIIFLPLKQATQIVNVAKLQVQRQREMLQEEADELMLIEFPDDSLLMT